MGRGREGRGDGSGCLVDADAAWLACGSWYFTSGMGKALYPICTASNGKLYSRYQDLGRDVVFP